MTAKHREGAATLSHKHPHDQNGSSATLRRSPYPKHPSSGCLARGRRAEAVRAEVRGGEPAGGAARAVPLPAGRRGPERGGERRVRGAALAVRAPPWALREAWERPASAELNALRSLPMS